ncbi:ABC transporter permease [Rhodococcus sp. OK302]|uniref:ABC transporter permease n=1 Tax=Rhodococcus sp. OK302 TaxID=1882769 RepID=UPI0020CCC746|nr:ABC transporter permease [Rhodococcus sp. OK302]
MSTSEVMESAADTRADPDVKGITEGLRGPTDASARGPSSGKSRVRRWDVKIRIIQLLIGVGLLGLWQLCAELQWPDPVLAKSPGEAYNYLTQAASSGELWSNTKATMLAVSIAWVIGSVAGVAAGITLGLLPRLEKVLDPFLDAANAMPRIALAPLLIVAFGINTTAKVALAVTLVFFIVMSGARAGVRSTDSEWMRLSVVLGAKKRHLFMKIFIPVATPAIFAALRLGLIYSLLGVVGSELISAQDGLGQLISSYSATFRMDAVYAILLMLAVIAATLNQLMSVLEQRLLVWQPPADR